MAAYWSSLNPLMTLLNLLPFAGLLLLIAVLPLGRRTAPWWDKPSNKLMTSVACAAAGLALFYLPTHDAGRVMTTALDYLAFIALLTALFVVSGGISISGAFAGLPWINTLFLAIGALLASVLGTTGASMLLIRPLIRSNRLRQHKTHIVVFFIFLVSNCGGLLTPLGDPPLYLGFLRGVPFFWTLRLFLPWLVAVGLLLIIFHFLDERIFEKEELGTRENLAREIAQAERKLHIRGKRNLVYLAAILGTVLFSGSVLPRFLEGRLSPADLETASKGLQIAILGALAWFSHRHTPAAIREHNHFHFAPIQEVAILFFGIFGAMLPALAVLEFSAGRLPLTEPWHFFWSAGILSSFLDNAPTYLSFASLAAGKTGLDAQHLGALAAQAPALLSAIAAGSVLMGAATYIGNGPNFMVKAIAEHAQIKMPSFGGYLLWSLGILIPVFLVETLLFFR
jgi:Na+/H+ antiporter NhaD/arsenite permease-like protein